MADGEPRRCHRDDGVGVTTAMEITSNQTSMITTQQEAPRHTSPEHPYPQASSDQLLVSGQHRELSIAPRLDQHIAGENQIQIPSLNSATKKTVFVPQGCKWHLHAVHR